MCIRDRLKAVLRLFVGAHRLVVHSAGAAESGIVAVQDLLVGACHRCAQSVALTQDVYKRQVLHAGAVIVEQQLGHTTVGINGQGVVVILAALGDLGQMCIRDSLWIMQQIRRCGSSARTPGSSRCRTASCRP